MQCQQQNIESMKAEEVEYLDYHRPKEVRAKVAYERDPEIEAIAQKLHSVKNIQPQPIQTQVQVQTQPQHKPSFTPSLTLKLQRHSIIAKVGNHLDSQCDAILLPYLSAQFQYKPCSEFRDQLKADSQKITSLSSQPGELYLRAKKLLHYKFRAFVKVAKETAISDMTYGLDSLFKLIEENPKKLDINSIAIIYTEELTTIQEVFDLLLSLKLGPLPTPPSIHLLLPDRSLLTQLFTLAS